MVICPECGSSKVEFIDHQFTETIKRAKMDGISTDMGLNSKIKLINHKSESEDNVSSITIPRKNRYICNNCGKSFSDNTDTFISGYKIFITPQFISDYYRLTVKSDLVEFFLELKDKLPNKMKKALKDEKRFSGTYQFIMEIIISKVKYSLTCEIDFEKMTGINMEGLVRKK